MLSILVKPSCLSALSKMGVSNMRHRTESNNMQRGTLMSFQEFSDGTLPEYFHNLWRKKFMTEKQLAKLWKNEMMEEGYEEMEYEESE